MQRRRILFSGLAASVGVTLGALPVTAHAATGDAPAEPAWAKGADVAQRWQREGGVLLVRHAATESGLGDPVGFTLGQCRTQRNLSPEGRSEAIGLGAWMRSHHLQPDAVRTSQWCRCQDTARLAFGQAQDWAALNSTFQGQGDAKAQQAALRERLLTLPEGRLEVWVTHQVVMTALTGLYPAMGEGFWVDRQGRVWARHRWSA